MQRFIIVSLIARLGLFQMLVVPAEAAPKDLDTYDAVPLLQGDIHNADDRRAMWDNQMLLSALQGLVNRDTPQLYAFQVISKEVDLDHYWLDKLQEPGGWLESTQIHPKKDLMALVSKYRALIRGVVVWDERVPATANVAATAAGVDDLLPVRYDLSPNSLFYALIKDPNGPRLPIILRLMNTDGSPMFTGSVSGSAKCDAYLWAVDHYLKKGKCATNLMGYYPDAWWLKGETKTKAVNTLLCNHDYFIAHRAFFFDLTPWEDEAPNDDLSQPIGTDNETMLKILGQAYKNANGGIVHIGGFVPWDQKYTERTGGSHTGVPNEWRFSEITSCFNAFIDADAPGLHAMANASVFQHFPLKKSYPQTNLPSEQDLKDKGYLDASGNVTDRNFVTFYVGDYDSAAWLYQKMPSLWDDPNRGEVPMGWAFNPVLAKRFPVGMAYARATATANDTFVAGDSGYGYLNPGFLEGSRPWSGLPSGLKAWEKLCTEAYQQWDLRISGFILDGNAPETSAEMKAAYTRFSPEGVVAAKLTPTPPMLVNGVPFMKKGPDIDKRLTINQKTARVYKALPHSEPKQPNFAHFRIILWSPTQLKELRDTIRAERPDIEVVEPHTLFALLRRNLNNK